MPQFDSSVFPYFDDFDVAKHYYQILFRPRVAVQARELNQIQSTVYNQQKRFADHIFEEGSIVKGGDIKIDTQYNFIKVVATPGSDLESETFRENNFLNKIIQGEDDVKALIVNHLPPSGGFVTFFVKYQASDTTSGSIRTFQNDEVVTVLNSAGALTGITATLIGTSSSGVGSAVNIKEGILYARGKFILFPQQSLILDPYSNVPSYRVGFDIIEGVVFPDDDTSLNDNAAGFPNANAPGAHRLKIELELTKLSLGTQGTDDFIELLEVSNGELTKNKILVTDYSELEKTLARRTEDESGDYTVNTFPIDIREFYDSGSNRGIYVPAQFEYDTQNEAKAVSISRFNVTSPGTAHQVGSKWRPGSNSTDLVNLMKAKLAVGIDPGKAYVKGYEIRTLARQYIDEDKARTFESSNNATIKCPIGNYVRVTKIWGLPDIKLYSKVELHDKLTETSGTSVNSQIGTARVRGFELESTEGTPSLAIYRLYLFDIQMNPGKEFFQVKQFYQAGPPKFVADVSPTFSALQGTISVAHDSTTATGSGTIWKNGEAAGQALVTGDYIASRDKSGVVRYMRVTNNPDFDNILAVTAPSPSGDSSEDIENAAFYYLFATLHDPQTNILVFPLPQMMVKTVTSDGITVDTNYFIQRIFKSLTVSSGAVAINTSHADEEFVPFTEADWFVTRDDNGSSFVLDSGDVVLSNNDNTATISSLTGTNVTVIATIRKKQGVPASAKTKSLNQNATVTVTSNAGLNEISLGKADIIKINAIYMSPDFSTTATTSHPNIIERYELDNGQRDEFYDLGKLIRKNEYPVPTGRLLISFDYYSHGGNGNYFSVDTYTAIDGLAYENIPTYISKGLGWTYYLRDCLDFRPRIKDDGTNFDNNTNGSSLSEMPKRGSVFADFQYYLNRIDKLYLSKSGEFVIRKGINGINPPPPEEPTDGMVTHQFNIPAYTIATSDIVIDVRDNRRYTMRDIGKLEKRIENLEYYTSLNLLEKDTADMLIPDENGLDRFKNGFIVDNFRGSGLGDTLSGEFQVSIDMKNGEARPMYWSDHVNVVEKSTTPEQRILDHYQITGDLFTLPYEEVTFINQPICSNTVFVNPFNVVVFIGQILLNPPNDEWKDTERVPDLVVNQEGNFDAIQQTLDGIGTVWNEWQTMWTGEPQVTQQKTIVGSEVSEIPLPHQDPQNLAKLAAGKTKKVWMSKPGIDPWPHRDIINTRTTTTVDTKQSREGVRGHVIPKVITQDLGDKVVSVGYVPFIRSRDIEFRGKGLMPNTKFYPFFDGIDVSGHCSKWADPNTPEVFNPLDLVSIGTPLITDATGKVSGTFRIPNTDSIHFSTGERVFKLSSSSDGSQKIVDSSASTTYRAQGLLEAKQKTILSTRNAEVAWESVVEDKIVTDATVSDVIEKGPWMDPIAETFLVEEIGGCFLTSIEVFFETKDLNIPVTLEVRETINGYPGTAVVPFSRVVKDADDVSISNDGTVSTKFTFSSPVYTKQGQEYAIVILSNSNKYKVWVASMGVNPETGLNYTKFGTEIPIVDQPYNGSFFKSQNASTWTADQFVDLKFKINKAEFDTSTVGAVTFVNDVIPSVTLDGNPFFMKSGESKVRVIHRNHGFRSDGSKQSRVTISGASGTINGISSASLNGTKIILSCDLDSYIFDSGSNATATGRGGGSGIVATENRQMDIVMPVVQHIVLPGTDIQYSIKSTSSKSVHDGGTGGDLYVLDSSFVSIIPNENYEFIFPKMIASSGNETQHLSGNKSFQMKAILSSNNPNISPVIDIQRLAAIVIANRLDNPTLVSINDSDLDISSIVSTRFVAGTTEGITTTDSNVASVLSQIQVGKVLNINVDTAARGTLTSSGNPSNGDTVTIDGKVYTFQTSLTNSNGNVLIGATAADSLTNLVAAIILGSGSGTTYAASTTLHSTVTATNVDSSHVDVIAKVGGSAGNAIAVSESSSSLSWGAGTLTLGADDAVNGDFTVSSVSYTPSGSPKITITFFEDYQAHTSNYSSTVISQYERYVDERGPKGGSASSKYITKRMVLAQSSNGLRISFSAVKPPSCNLDVYYKLGKVDDSTPFDDINWELAEVDGTSGDSTNVRDFREYNYTIDGLSDFNASATKIVMRGTNTCEVVKIKEFRLIALGT